MIRIRPIRIPSSAYNLDEAYWKKHLSLPSGSKHLQEGLKEYCLPCPAQFRDASNPWITSIELDADAHFPFSGQDAFRPNGERIKNRSQPSQNSKRTVMILVASLGKKLDERLNEMWQGDFIDSAFFLHAFSVGFLEQLIHKSSLNLYHEYSRQNLRMGEAWNPNYTGEATSEFPDFICSITNHPDWQEPWKIRFHASGGMDPAMSWIGIHPLEPQDPMTELKPEYLQYPEQPKSDFIPQTACLSRDRAVETSYTFHKNTLRKWEEEHLTLAHQEDGVIHALFEYQATTCSHSGIEFSVDYNVQLENNSGRYRILKMRCSPKDDQGQAMCALEQKPLDSYLEFFEIPDLAGTDLADILNWQPETSPAGCLCRRKDRWHKWRIVLQTLHFKLCRVNEALN